MTRPGGQWRNWAATAKVRPQRVEFPRSVEAVQRARKRHDDSVRELPRAATRLSQGEAAIPTVLEN